MTIEALLSLSACERQKNANQMADNTSLCSFCYEEKSKFIQMTDCRMESITVCMSWTLANRYSAALDTLYVWLTLYLEY